jgi:hypothetical protein
MGQAAMGLESEPSTGMEIGCGERAAIPADRVDDKIRRQMNLPLEVPEEQTTRWPHLTQGSRGHGANRKDLRLPRFHITYSGHRPASAR